MQWPDRVRASERRAIPAVPRDSTSNLQTVPEARESPGGYSEEMEPDPGSKGPDLGASFSDAKRAGSSLGLVTIDDGDFENLLPVAFSARILTLTNSCRKKGRFLIGPGIQRIDDFLTDELSGCAVLELCDVSDLSSFRRKSGPPAVCKPQLVRLRYLKFSSASVA